MPEGTADSQSHGPDSGPIKVAPRSQETASDAPEVLTSRHLDELEPDVEPLCPPPDSLAGYEIVRMIHEGGQGVVYQAIQKATKRKVAVKVMKEGPFATKRDKARFEREVEILGQLNHPNIVAIHDSGTASGSFYFVMDYISGQPLEIWMASSEHSVEEVLRLFAKICEAVNAAHLRGIIHRDLKPGNIRIGVDGEPHILDFGLAKVASGSDAALMTVTGQFVGSLPWASPEQAEGIPAKIDTRTDVYSLGVILYQMLTGRFPYDVMGSMRDVLEHILRTDPARPSAIRRQINDEVDTIVLKCLSKNREERYQTAGELARDIHHYLSGEAIEAKRSSTFYVLRKHLRQYRLPLAIAAGFVVVVTLALFVSLGLLRQARHAEALATAARDGERSQREAADQQRSLAQHRERIAEAAYAAGALEQGTALHLAGRGQESRVAFVRARDAYDRLGQSTLAAEVGLYHSFRDFDAPVNSISGHSDGLMAVAWCPDGVRACSAAEDGTVRLWDTRTGEEIQAFRGHRGVVTSVAVSPDGRYILSGGEDQTVRLWSTQEGKQLRSFADPTGQVRGVAFSPDGEHALSAPAERGGAVRLWNIQTGQLVRSFNTPGNDACYGVAFSPDGRRVLATTYERSILVWDAATGELQRRLRGHTGYVISAAFSPDGGHILSASYDQTLRYWDLATGNAIQTLKGHTAGVRGVGFVGLGHTALSCSMDGTLKLWNIETGEVHRTFAGHVDGIRGVAVSPDGRRAISAGTDKTVKVWDLGPNAETPAISGPGVVTSLACSGDGTTFVSGDSRGAVNLVDRATFRVLRGFVGHARPIDCAVLLPDGHRLFAADSAGDCRIWDVFTGRLLGGYAGFGPGESRYYHGGAWSCTSVSPDGSLVLSARPDRSVAIRNLESGSMVGALIGCRREVSCVAVSPDSRHALCGDEGGELYYWSLPDGRCLFSVPVAPKLGRLDCVAFSADGKYALTGGHELAVRLWDLRAGTQIREFPGATLVVKAVGFGRGDRSVFAVGGDQTLRVWDAQNAQELPLGAALPRYCFAMAVVPPGDAVLAGSGRSVSLWDVSRAQRHLEFAPRLDAARAALRSNSDDPVALATLGECYAFRGVNDWAVQLLEGARARGAAVSALTLARCYWQIGRTDDAAREFRTALTRHEAPADYLNLCLAAVADPASTRPSTAPAAQTAEDAASQE